MENHRSARKAKVAVAQGVNSFSSIETRLPNRASGHNPIPPVEKTLPPNTASIPNTHTVSYTISYLFFSQFYRPSTLNMAEPINNHAPTSVQPNKGSSSLTGACSTFLSISE